MQTFRARPPPPSPPSFQRIISFLTAATQYHPTPPPPPPLVSGLGRMFSPLCFSAKCPATSSSGRLFFFGCMKAGLIHAPVGLRAKSRSDTLSYQKIIALHTPAKALRGGSAVLLALTIRPLILKKTQQKKPCCTF